MTDIVLTGPKHSGKTSAGKILTSLYSCEFIDIDELILQRTGKSPRELYSESVKIFQKAEADAMDSLLADSGKTEQRRVIATGGGVIDNNDALEILNKLNAVIVYLDIYADSAWDRISSSMDGILPPALRTGNPRETHTAMHERRAAAYLQLANIVIFAEGKTPDEIAAEIIESVTAFM